ARRVADRNRCAQSPRATASRLDLPGRIRALLRAVQSRLDGGSPGRRGHHGAVSQGRQADVDHALLARPAGQRAAHAPTESCARDAATGSAGAELSDATVVKRGDQWWMYLAGQAHGYGPTELYSASLPAGAPLTPEGWSLTRDQSGALIPLAGRNISAVWDGN